MTKTWGVLVARMIGRPGGRTQPQPFMMSDTFAQIPLLIEFAAGTSLFREPDLVQHLPILQNGPPGTFVLFPGGFRVSLPTDQIVYADDSGEGARVGFGGMNFAGVEAERLIFHRVREMHPEEQLSPARSRTMVLNPGWVVSISIEGREVWTASRPT